MSVAQKIVETLKVRDEVRSTEIDAPYSETHGALISLESKGICNVRKEESYEEILTPEGEEIEKNGSQEYLLFKSIGKDGMSIDELGKYELGKMNAFKNKWIKKRGDKVFRNIEEVEDMIRNMVISMKRGDATEEEIEILRKRKLVIRKKNVVFVATKGPMFFDSASYATELTSEMILDGTYKGLTFKHYNFNTKGNTPQGGSIHPLMKIREDFKRIFIELGFSEMSTNQYVESSFWNFDALFQPQNHPSRDAHDTFFLLNPELSSDFPKDYLNKVSETHCGGKYGSLGYMNSWDVREAQKNILRTHTTSVSTRNLYKLASEGFRPVKLFSIDKVFRNESIDATHLAEFHQVEGLIAGKGLNITHLMGILQEFFNRLGMRDIRFKPAYNPYTEPSMEVFGYHKGMNRWMEVGNSGVFRPEMLGPMGFDSDVSVIAWGLSLERPAMIKYGLKNIRELVGHKVDIEFSRKSEICFFD
ncbi:phenylalanyl-tRNA synthetase subunit alpha [Encephalitozoon hellem ATCC 50504]|uniref:Probable phenylalanine--tRNA ligase alpha subunit n=1 Tax=Encephalitozoon hellem TaxID=27973 RepID=A0A9Q9C3T2_ENCHE|nr:phenylalanyl-tRNA synthetase subunit alpha [Encephalitozoon hellem ATCC 50504]AFM98686.1 phenylalanyl-tRNA synthetase subunit alpha [Encephalitozoon hellem ATCC 50504]UTX43636.1 phenylalanyl-tRNA synthetase subunit alpha [Encephalitozoon hellem]WEL39112.1 phenylalanyl-tRNA synthetase subunit alpha [Encephalitozoon hellem]|eukprot:XP_003887667.1 phenylalanyl-tRNA synthetase subunit alpha [Encephalitozoon hellem ATCC 50504]